MSTTADFNNNNDPWLALDKLGHFLFCGACTFAGYLLCLRRWDYRRWRFAVGAALGVAVGALKEIGDGLGWWPGNVSVRDMGADLIGIAAALVLLVYFDTQLSTKFGSGKDSLLVPNKEQEIL